MNEPRHGLSDHPAPHRERVGTWQAAFGIFGGPLAWFVQLCVGYGLMATPCYPGPERQTTLSSEAAWTVPANIVVYLLCLALAVAAGFMALRSWRRTRGEKRGTPDQVMEAGHGRTRFLAVWGVLLGFGFAIVIAANAVALLVVPPCAL